MPCHSKGKQNKSQEKHPCGPLKRAGAQAQQWDEIIGPSLSAIPGHQLPLVKTILQRYRAIRIQHPTDKIYNLATQIAEEVTVIWIRARVPAISLPNATNKVVDAVKWWKSKHNLEAVSPDYIQKLFDIAPKPKGKCTEESQLDHLKNIMRTSCAMQRRKSEGKNYDWEVDFQFYVDQAKVSKT